MSVIPKGQEPERIKKRMDILFAKLDEAYPDKVIIYLQRDHKKWSETVRELYQLLGYEDNKSFLEAYGYIYERANGGRSNAFDPNELINTLKEKYQDSPKRNSIGELMLDNPEIKGNLKTLQNKAPELFGMSLSKYLKDLGILSTPKPEVPPKTKRVDIFQSKCNNGRKYCCIYFETKKQEYQYIFCNSVCDVTLTDTSHGKYGVYFEVKM